MLTNDKITLRAMEPADIDVMYRWENDTDLWPIGNTSRPFSREVLGEFIAGAAVDVFAAGQMRLVITLNATGEPIGCIDLFEIDPLNRRAGVGILIYDPKHRGQSYGKQALELLTEYAFNYLEIRQLYADIPVSNAASRGMFASVGFSESGLRRAWVRKAGGGYEDSMFMQLLNNK